MKRLLAVMFVLSASPVFAQAPVAAETYSLLTNTLQNATRVDRARISFNRLVCLRFNLVTTCTQAQACTAASAAGGAACTAAQARTSNVRIYPQSLVGREEFAQFETFVPAIQSYFSQSLAADQDDFCRAWTATMTQTQKNTACAQAGLPAACDLCR